VEGTVPAGSLNWWCARLVELAADSRNAPAAGPRWPLLPPSGPKPQRPIWGDGRECGRIGADADVTASGRRPTAPAGLRGITPRRWPAAATEPAGPARATGTRTQRKLPTDQVACLLCLCVVNGGGGPGTWTTRADMTPSHRAGPSCALPDGPRPRTHTRLRLRLASGVTYKPRPRAPVYIFPRCATPVSYQATKQLC